MDTQLRIIRDFDALKSSAGRRVFDSLFAFHTGEIGGMAGRVFALVTGAGLMAMIVLGVSLWLARN